MTLYRKQGRRYVQHAHAFDTAELSRGAHLIVVDRDPGGNGWMAYRYLVDPTDAPALAADVHAVRTVLDVLCAARAELDDTPIRLSPAGIAASETLRRELGPNFRWRRPSLTALAEEVVQALRATRPEPPAHPPIARPAPESGAAAPPAVPPSPPIAS